MKHTLLPFIAFCLAGWLLLTANTAVQAATFTVTNNNDSGAGSLRNQIAAAAANPGPDTIDFAASLSGQTIALTSGELSINHDVTIDGSALAERLTIDGQNNNGRILYIVDGTVTIDSLRFINGDSNDGDPGEEDGNGGAMHIAYAASVTIQNSEFTDNQSQSNGGALYILQTPITVTNNTFTNNSTQFTGGAIRNADGAHLVNITNNTFVDNVANGEGGAALFLSGGAEVVANNTFSNNRNVYAVYHYTPLQLNNNTFLGTDGVYVRSSEAVLHMRNNIIGGCLLNGGSIGTNINNWIVNSSCSLASNGNPNLGALANNGGPTHTAVPLPSSGLIDAGDATTCANLPGGNFDQRGAAREGNCDIGAVEVRPTETACASGSLDVNVPATINGIGFLFTDFGTADCITVERMGSNHLLATSGPTGGIDTGDWWHITADGTGFTVNVTLPHSGLSNPLVCKYPGTQGGYGWDCDRTDSDSSTVWLNGVTSFSDWAVGNNVGPTAVNLFAFSTNPELTGFQNLSALMVLLLGAATAVFLRLRRHN